MKPRCSQPPPLSRLLPLVLAFCLALLPVRASAQTTPPAPNDFPAPVLNSASAGNRQVSLSWAAVRGASSYNVYRGTSAGHETILTTGVASTSYTDTSARNGTTYYYVITAVFREVVSAGGESGPSNERSATPHGGSHNNTATDAAIGAVIIGGIIAATSGHHHGPARNSADDLRDNGPRFPEREFSLSNFVIYGFIEGGWPLIIQYGLDAPADVKMTITADNGQQFVVPLNGTQPGQQEVKIQLPDQIGDRVQVGQIAISAQDDSGQGAPQKLHLYAIGCGPTAVGSVTVDQIAFEPKTIRVKDKESTGYRFRALRDFPRSAVDFYRLEARSGEVRATHVAGRKGFPLLSGKSYGPDKHMVWDGKDDHKHPSIGDHLLQVRAWTDPKTDGSWLAAAPSELLTVMNE